MPANQWLCFLNKNYKMSKENLDKKVSIELTTGHLVFLWNFISDKLSGSPLNEEFTEEEKRAIWGLADLCEQELINNEIKAMPEPEWESLIERAKEHVKSLPVEYLD